MKKPITLVLREPSKPVYTKKQVRKLVHDAFKAGLINTYQNDSDAQLLRTMSTFQEPSGKVARAISTALKARFRQECFATRLLSESKASGTSGRHATFLLRSLLGARTHLQRTGVGGSLW
jgi:hypothetical protein